jgi:hypothetical protein
VIEADPVTEAMIELARQAYSWAPDPDDPSNRRVWKGTPGTLLEEISKLVPEDIRRDRGWPKDATRLAGRLRCAAPPLATKNIVIDRLGKERADLGNGRKGNSYRMLKITAPLPDNVAEPNLSSVPI